MTNTKLIQGYGKRVIIFARGIWGVKIWDIYRMEIELDLIMEEYIYIYIAVIFGG